MSNANIEPNALLDMLRDEMDYAESATSKRTNKTLKVPKGATYAIRWLPVEQGPRKSYWARYAFHWINRRPTLCPRHTSPDFGGIKGAECDLCETAAVLNDSADEWVSHIGYKAMAVPQWLLYALLLEKDDGDRLVRIREPELWTPYEMYITRTSFEDLMLDFRDGTRYSPQSFMDLGANGCSFSVTNLNKKGLRFKPRRNEAMIPDDRFDEVTQLIWSQIKFPNHKVPSARDLALAARKLVEYSETGGGEDDDDGRGRRDDRRGRDDDRRGRDDRDTRRSRDDEDEPRSRSRDYDEDREERRPAPRREEPADDYEASDREREEPRDERPERPARPAPAPAPVRAPTPPPRAAATPPPPARPSAAPRAVAPPPARAVPPPPARGPVASSVDDNEDTAPEEKVDHAPAEPLTDDAPPPPVDAEGSAAKPKDRLSDRLRRGIAAAENR